MHSPVSTFHSCKRGDVCQSIESLILQRVTADLGGAVVAPADSDVARNIEGPDAPLMTNQNPETQPLLDIPYANDTVSRARHSDRPTVKHFDASDCGRMASQHM